MTMKGHELITRERVDQMEKHGFTVERDLSIGSITLMIAAQAILNWEADEWPDAFDMDVFLHILRKPQPQQWAIAGAFLAAAIDVHHLEQQAPKNT